MSLKSDWQKHLAPHGVKLPKGSSNNRLVLEYLYAREGQWVKKSELIAGIGYTGPDLQAPRHLGYKEGYNIESDRQSPISYRLTSIINLHKDYALNRKKDQVTGWDALKKAFGYRCATCGSKEGEPCYPYPAKVCRLDKGHMDPNKELVDGNVIPQCTQCNGMYKNDYIFDSKGRVKDINRNANRWN